jgi:glyoxylase-like metal-dependent hydrolase (beta-lactamase superfamily II)
MIRERISDDVYVFRSRRYAQVTSGAIMTKEGVILIDTLFYPEETAAIRDFLEERLGQNVRYIVNTHYHADHTLGTCQFPHAQVISHRLCRQLLDSVGREGLAHMQTTQSEFADVDIILPDMVFDEGHLNVHLGGKTVRLVPLPGHSQDLIGAFVLEERILFASDTAMPVPTMFDGDYDALVASMHHILKLKPDSIVRGHGEVILRGEVEALIEDDLSYLALIWEKVSEMVSNGKGEADLTGITIESCGKSRIPLNGFVADLHQANLQRLYHDMTGNGQIGGDH